MNFSLFCYHDDSRILKEIKNQIIKLEQKLTMDITELTQKLVEDKALLEKAAFEITGKIQELKDALSTAGTEVPQAAVDALAALELQAKALDDIVPDKEPAPEEVKGEPEAPVEG